jgi:putative PIN family toxin of toxin-antitoxin system
MRVTLDANVLVSALLAPGGAPAEVVRLGAAGRRRLCLADTILAELRALVARPRIVERCPRAVELAEAFLQAVEPVSEIAVVVGAPAVITADPHDDHVLECARLLRADVIVSGDRHLLDLRRHGSIPILSPAAFVADVAAHDAR